MTTESSVLFLIGQNSRGKWIAQKQDGRCGGLFVSRDAALKFALRENGHRPEAVITVPGVFELDMSGRNLTVCHVALGSETVNHAPWFARDQRDAVPKAA
jgi:hypothetical protein